MRKKTINEIEETIVSLCQYIKSDLDTMEISENTPQVITALAELINATAPVTRFTRNGFEKIADHIEKRINRSLFEAVRENGIPKESYIDNANQPPVTTDTEIFLGRMIESAKKIRIDQEGKTQAPAATEAECQILDNRELKVSYHESLESFLNYRNEFQKEHSNIVLLPFPSENCEILEARMMQDYIFAQMRDVKKGYPKQLSRLAYKINEFCNQLNKY